MHNVAGRFVFGAEHPSRRAAARLGLTLALGLLGVTHPADAAAVGPEKFSDVRVVFGTSSSPLCPGTSGARRVDTLQKPDGTTASFSIPQGKVYVITSWDWISTDVTAGLAAVDLVVVDASGQSVAELSLGREATTETPLGGTRAAGGTVAIPSGAIVKPGAHLCAASNGQSHAVVVRGFLATDR